MLLFIGTLGLQEIILILVLAMLLFGPKKLPEIGRALGKGMREFKKSTSDLVDNLNDEIKKPVPTEPTPQQPERIAAPISAGPVPPRAATPPEPKSAPEPEAVVVNLEDEDTAKS